MNYIKIEDIINGWKNMFKYIIFWDSTFLIQMTLDGEMTVVVVLR